jgi:hypothetical protein
MCCSYPGHCHCSSSNRTYSGLCCCTKHPVLYTCNCTLHGVNRKLKPPLRIPTRNAPTRNRQPLLCYSTHCSNQTSNASTFLPSQPTTRPFACSQAQCKQTKSEGFEPSTPQNNGLLFPEPVKHHAKPANTLLPRAGARGAVLTPCTAVTSVLCRHLHHHRSHTSLCCYAAAAGSAAIEAAYLQALLQQLQILLSHSSAGSVLRPCWLSSCCSSMPAGALAAVAAAAAAASLAQQCCQRAEPLLAHIA